MLNKVVINSLVSLNLILPSTQSLADRLPAQIKTTDVGITKLAHIQDIDGWGNARWGMSIEQVRKLYPFGDLKLAPNGINRSGTYRYVTINDHQYEARFNFVDEKLEAITLAWHPKEDDPTNYFSVVLEEMRYLYGEPSKKTYDIAYDWILPSTEINLYGSIDNPQFQIIIIYTHRNRSQDF
jgi:hypothetical protein